MDDDETYSARQCKRTKLYGTRALVSTVLAGVLAKKNASFVIGDFKVSVVINDFKISNHQWFRSFFCH